jgi:excinuclease UvrABC nuclease subunit
MQTLAFDPADAKAALTQLPTSAAVFALYGAEAHSEPYIGRTPNLRGRLERLLQPSPKHPRRLQLAGRVRRIAWRLTGSEFESLLAQFSLLEEIYGPKSLERMHLRAPAFVRFLGGNPYPRITVTHRPGQREADWAYGPFQSRAAAERFADEALKLFLLRRCTDDLSPNPSHPGCVYSEMKMCLAPCYQGCTDERYGEEAAAVESFLATRGESRLVPLRTQRDEASASLEFESAAALHAQVVRAEAVRGLAAELVRPMSQLRAVILQASANPDEVAVFVYENSRLRGPAAFSTLGMRIQNEQSGSTSLFAQPVAIEPIPETSGTSPSPSQQMHQEQQQVTGRSFSPAEHSPQDDEASQVVENYNPVHQQSGLVTGHDFSRAETSQQEEGALAPEGMPSPIPTEFSSSPSTPAPSKLARSVLESRLESDLAALADPTQAPPPTLRQGHLALLKRWYYRPEARRDGEIFFPCADGQWPVKAILRGVGRVAGKMLTDGSRTA